ncbi:hypothetical protein [Paraburkholderia sp. BR14374]|uniref:hypothetical protein n=1 Tax=Paraburkholderia sp. BR14374 TaxID=3237007 RepID=UPI0034D00201
MHYLMHSSVSSPLWSALVAAIRGVAHPTLSDMQHSKSHQRYLPEVPASVLEGKFPSVIPISNVLGDISQVCRGVGSTIASAVAGKLKLEVTKREHHTKASRTTDKICKK